MVWILCVCLSVCECECACMCVSRPLWSPLIPNLTDLLQRQPLMCAESLSGILDAVSIIFTSLSIIRNALFCFLPHDAGIVRQDRWLLSYEFVYDSGVFSPVLWSVILHLWALLIPFLSCVSLLIFDPNLKPPRSMGQRGWGELFFSPSNSMHTFFRESRGPLAFGFSFSRAKSERYLLLYVSIYLCFIAVA